MTSGEPLAAAPLEAWLRRFGTTPGQLAFGGLGVLVVTGVALGVPYDPASPLASVEALQERVPFGWLLRGAHVVGAQLFLVALLAHTLDHVAGGSFREVARGAWWRLVAVLALGIGAMFSGFLLRGDAEARAAQAIAIGVTRQIPWAGESLAALFFGDPEGSLQVVYLHHLVTFSLVPWLLAAEHARRLWSGWLVSAACLAAATLGGLVYHPGPGPAPGTPSASLLGPWYTAGVQETLRVLPPALGALALPLAWVLALGVLGHLAPQTPPERSLAARIVASLVFLGALAYLVATLAAYAWRAPWSS